MTTMNFIKIIRIQVPPLLTALETVTAQTVLAQQRLTFVTPSGIKCVQVMEHAGKDQWSELVTMISLTFW